MSISKIARIEVFQVDAGWRDWIFIKVSSTSGIDGFSEITESNGSISALFASIGDLSKIILGQYSSNVNELSTLMRRAMRQSLPGTLWKAAAGIENALWDLVSKELGVPISSFFDLQFPTSISAPVYWSHCPTTRIRAFEKVNKRAVNSNLDLAMLANEVVSLEFGAIKTNIFNFDMHTKIRMPGFAKSLSDLRSEITNSDIKNFSKSMHFFSGFMESTEILVDLNFNFDLQQFSELQKQLHKLPIKWLEIDFDDVGTRESILSNKQFPICTGENILGLYNFHPLLQDYRIDIISIDVLWNGLSESVKIMNYAVSQGKRISIHNYYSPLASAMALLFYQFIPESQRELLEFDYDDVPWRERIMVNPPIFGKGHLTHSREFGWGVTLNQQELTPLLKQNLVFEDC